MIACGNFGTAMILRPGTVISVLSLLSSQGLEDAVVLEMGTSIPRFAFVTRGCSQNFLKRRRRMRSSARKRLTIMEARSLEVILQHLQCLIFKSALRLGVLRLSIGFRLEFAGVVNRICIGKRGDVLEPFAGSALGMD